jgi:hypothetical protein
MDLLEKYRRPLYNLENESGAPEPIAADPPADSAIVDPVVGDPPAEPDADSTPQPDKKPRPADTFINTITGLRAAKRELEGELERARREASEARALAERLAAGKEPPQTPTQRPQVEAAPTDEAEVDRRAEYKLFVRDVNDIRAKGVDQFGAQFGETIRALAAVGADDDAFVSQVMAVDKANAHVLLNELAQDLERTVNLVGMDPTRRIAELTRMSMATKAKADDKTAPAAPGEPKAPPKIVSKAPPPPPPVTPSASKEVDWRSDAASDEEFNRGFEEMMKRRSARR